MDNKALFPGGFKVIDDARDRLCNKVTMFHAIELHTENDFI